MGFDPFNLAQSTAGSADASIGAAATGAKVSGFDPFSVGGPATGTSTTNRDLGAILSSSASPGTKGAATAAAAGKGHGNWVSGILNAIDTPRAAAMSLGRQLEHVATGKGFNAQQLAQDFHNHITTTQLLNNVGIHGWQSRVLGFLGDAAADPTTYLTLGTGTAAELGARGVMDAIAEAANAGDKALTAETFARVAAKGTSALQPEERAALAAKGYSPGGLHIRVPLTRLSSHLGLGAEKTLPVLPHTATDPLAAAGTGLWHSLADTKIGQALSSKIFDMPELRSVPVRQALRSGDPNKALGAYNALKAQALLHSIPKGLVDVHGPTLLDALHPFKNANSSQLSDLRNALEGDQGAAASLAAQGLSHEPAQAALATIRQAANASGADIKDIGSNYFPHVLSDEGRQILADKANLAGAIRGASKVGAEEGRQYKAGEDFWGHTLKTGSVDEIHGIAKAAGGGELFKTDPREALIDYLHQAAHAAGRGAFAQRLAESGVVKPFDAEAYSNIGKFGQKALKAAAHQQYTRNLLDGIEQARTAAGRQTDVLQSIKANMASARSLAAEHRVGAVATLAQHPNLGSLLQELNVREAVHPGLQEDAQAAAQAAEQAPTAVASSAAPAAAQEPLQAQRQAMAQSLQAIDARLAELHGQGVHPGSVDELTNQARALNADAKGIAKGAKYVGQTDGPTQLNREAQDALAAKAAEATRINDLLYEHSHLQSDRAELLRQAAGLKARTEQAGRAVAKAPSARFQKFAADQHEAQQMFGQADNAVRATAAQAAANVAENEARIAEIRNTLANAQGKVNQHLVEEAALRSQADHWMAAAKTIEDPQQRLLANLNAQAAQAEADLVRSGKELRGLALKGVIANNGKIATWAATELHHGWSVLGAEAGAKLAGKQAPTWMRDALAVSKDVQTANGLTKALHYYDQFLTRWKAYELLSPGKALRHQLGAVFNAYLGNVKLASYDAWAKLRSTVKGAGEGALSARDRKVWDAYQKMGVAHDSQFTEDEVLPTHEYSMNPLSTNFVALKVNRNVQNRAQDFVRGAMFHDAMVRQGLTAEQAASKVRTFLFDYHGLSPWERNVGRRLVPFYTFSRKNFPLMLEQMALQPGKFNLYTHAKQNLEYGTKAPSITPDFFNQLMGIRLPFDVQGNPEFVTPDLPFTRMGAVLGGGVNQDLSQLSPIIKNPIELWANKQVYNGLPFSKGYQKPPPLMGDIPFLMPALEKVGLAKKAGGQITTADGATINQGDYIMSPKNVYLVSQYIPILGQLMRLAPNQPKYQARVVSSWLTNLLGQNFQADTPQLQQSELLNRQQNVANIKSQLEKLGIIPSSSTQPKKPTFP